MGVRDLTSEPWRPGSSNYGNRKNDEPNFTGGQEKPADVKDSIEERQKKVFMLKSRGKSNKEIADKLQVSLSTIEKDLHELKSDTFKKFKVFQQEGLVEHLQDTLAQYDMLQAELWKWYETSGFKYKIPMLKLLQNHAAKKLDIFKLGLVNLSLLDKLNKQSDTLV
jgi:hypothetical protein